MVPYEASVERNTGAYYTAVNKLNEDQFHDIEKALSIDSERITKHSDDCNFWVYRGGGNPPHQVSPDCDIVWPVPHFFHEMIYFKVDDLRELPNDFILFVLEAKKGKYLKEDQLSNNLNQIVEWEHGITKSGALSKERMIALFWVDIW